jgi:hypothetical protein
MFDLHTAALDLLDNNPTTPHRELAKMLAEDVPSRELRPVLAEALVHYMARADSRSRYDSFPKPNRETVAPVHIPEQQNRRSGHNNRSAKVAGIRQQWAEWLTKSYNYGHQQRKPLFEFSLKDLTFAVEKRRGFAATLTNRADWLQDGANLVKEYEVERVGDLPKKVLDEWGQRGAELPDEPAEVAQ